MARVQLFLITIVIVCLTNVRATYYFDLQLKDDIVPVHSDGDIILKRIHRLEDFRGDLIPRYRPRRELPKLQDFDEIGDLGPILNVLYQTEYGR